ncbi:MAG: hypothetical protein OEW05_13700, partial [Candidatus Aminicenantes bacterium]|nr:hypothetical protein [Candidatus Aminicenantes bacterium]
VVHLVADMAEPDHATNTIHAASGFYYPKDLNKILTHLRAAAESVPGFKDWQERLEAMIAINAAVGEQRVGFEEHIERSPQELSLSPSAVKVNKFLSLDSYFNTMGRLSKDAIQNKFPLPIGVRLTPDTTEAEQAGLAALRANYSFFPAIDFKDPAEAEKYFKLARELLTSSVRLNWGVLEFFHDLVNPPPYVRSVEVKQGGRPCYSATWVDIVDTVSGLHPNDNEKAAEKLAAGRFYHRFRYDKVLRRELREQKGNQPLRPGVEAEVRLYFGPDPQGFAAQTERVKTVSVSVGGEPVSGRVIDDGTAWVGRFTPDLGEGEEERELQVEIEAVDAHAHSVIPGRQAFPRREALEREAGYRLDSEPDSPAKTDSDPPYHVRNYEPAQDFNHKVMVRAVAERPEDRAESSPWLNFEVAGDVVRPARDSAWSFNLNLNTTTDVWPELIEKEEWKFFPGGQWPSTYSRTVKEKGRAQQFFAPDITGLARPPEGRLQKGGEAEYELNLFDVDAQGRFKSGSARRSGNRIFHFFWITGKADPFVYKVRFKGRGRDGKVHQAEFVFDSREWVPAGKDSAGQTVYRKK